MDSMFMDQIIDSWLEEECGLPNFCIPGISEETSSQRRNREEKEEAENQRNKCPRCGGPLYYGGCDCTWDPGDFMNPGGWSSGD